MNIIKQSVQFNASPYSLFDAYLDSRKHAAIIGSKVSINKAAAGDLLLLTACFRVKTC